MDLARAAEWVWYGRGAAPAAVRAALAPAGWLFHGGSAVRSALYRAGVARTHPLGLPAVAVGNLTVGGTGKTPVAAWVCAELRRRGVRPALLLRGVGDDEARVHALLNPDVPVIADADRVRGAAAAAAAGATAVVLDDAFQHLRAARDADLVLLSAERGLGEVRLLPAGPYRESPAALGRASAVVVTRKSADATAATAVLAAARTHAPRAAGAIVALAPDAIRRWARDGGAPDAAVAPDALRGLHVLAIAGVGEPGAFAAQLGALGATVTLARFADHHAFTPAEAEALAARAAQATPTQRAVCTLKDAVKLGPLWPRSAPPLWYVTQRVTVERGGEALAAILDAVAAAGRAPSPGPRARPSAPSRAPLP